MKKRAAAAIVLAGTVAIGAMGANVADAQLSDTVTILHAIPGVTVDLAVDGEVVVAGFDAGDTQDLTPLAGMTLQDIEGRRAGTEDVVFGPIDSFTVPADGNNSVVVHRDATGTPTITSFSNPVPPTEQGRGELTVRHVAAAPPVALMIGGEEVLAGIDNGQGDGVVLPAGEIADAVVTVDGNPIAMMPNLQLEANSELIVYIGGSLADADLAFYQQSIAGGDIETPPAPSERQAAPEQGDSAAPAQGDSAPPAQGDGTPQPDQVNTGDTLLPRGTFESSPVSSTTLLAATVLSALALAAVIERRRRTNRSPAA